MAMQQARGQAWQQVVPLLADSSSASSAPAIEALVTDAAGDVYVAGRFEGHLTLGSLQLQSAGGADAFLAKWSPGQSRFVWALRAGGAGDDGAQALATDGTSLYLAGRFQSPVVTFGALALHNTDPTGTTVDSFLAKLTPTQNTAAFTWVVPWGGPGDNYLAALAVQGADLFVTGNSFAEITLAQTPVAYDNAFVAKLTDEGATARVQWAMPIGGAASALAVAGEAVYVAGEFRSPAITFGNVLLTKTEAGSSAFGLGQDRHAFVARLDDRGEQGKFMWAQRIGGYGNSVVRCKALAVEGAQVYLTGEFYGKAKFGPFLLRSSAYGHTGDVFLTKLVAAGDEGRFAWAQQLGGADEEQVQALLVKGHDVYVAGTFLSDSLALGALTLKRTRAPSTAQELFVAHVLDADTTSRVTWLRGEVTGGPAAATALALRGTTLYVAGQAQLPVAFSGRILTQAAGTHGAFLAAMPAGAFARKAAGQPKPAKRRSKLITK
ncbi:hypothetical protein GCM10028821_14110 [Hymenobacter jeollabukensis]